MQASERQKPLTTVEEILLEKAKEQVMKQVERQARVGTDLVGLRQERLKLDRILKETLDFNERILEPQLWNEKLRDRNRKEMEDMQKMRNKNRVNLISDSRSSNLNSQARSKSQLIQSAPVLSDHKKKATQIFIQAQQRQSPLEQSTGARRVTEESDQQTHEKLETFFCDDQERRLNEKNKQLQHLKKIRKLKQLSSSCARHQESTDQLVK